MIVISHTVDRDGHSLQLGTACSWHTHCHSLVQLGTKVRALVKRVGALTGKRNNSFTFTCKSYTFTMTTHTLSVTMYTFTCISYTLTDTSYTIQIHIAHFYVKSYILPVQSRHIDTIYTFTRQRYRLAGEAIDLQEKTEHSSSKPRVIRRSTSLAQLGSFYDKVRRLQTHRYTFLNTSFAEVGYSLTLKMYRVTYNS